MPAPPPESDPATVRMLGGYCMGPPGGKKSDFSSHAPYRRRSSRGDASRKRPVPACFAPVAVRRRGGGGLSFLSQASVFLADGRTFVVCRTIPFFPFKGVEWHAEIANPCAVPPGLAPD